MNSKEISDLTANPLLGTRYYMRLYMDVSDGRLIPAEYTDYSGYSVFDDPDIIQVCRLNRRHSAAEIEELAKTALENYKNEQEGNYAR